MEISNLKKLVEEIQHLEKSEQLLQEVLLFVGPYDKEINGRNCKDLAMRIHEHLNGFDDSE